MAMQNRESLLWYFSYIFDNYIFNGHPRVSLLHLSYMRYDQITHQYGWIDTKGGIHITNRKIFAFNLDCWFSNKNRIFQIINQWQVFFESLETNTSESHFTNEMLLAIEIRLKPRLAVVPLLAIRSQKSLHTNFSSRLFVVGDFIFRQIKKSSWQDEMPYWRNEMLP